MRGGDPKSLRGGIVGRLFSRIGRPRKRARTADELRQAKDGLEKLLSERTEALRASEARYKALVERAPVGIFEIDLVRGKFLSVNDVVARLSGYSREELLAIDPPDLLVPEDKARFLERLLRMTRGEDVPESVEYGFRTKSGETRWGLLNSQIVRENGIAVSARVIATDITERRAAEELLRRQQAEMRALLENTPAGLVLFDAKPPYRVLAHNRYYQELFAEPFRSRGMAGLSVYEYAPAVEAEGIVAVFDEVVRTQQPKSFLDFPYRSDPPKRSWFNWHISPLILDGEVVALVSMSLDVTDRHLAQEALRESEERFRLALRNAPVSVAAQDRDLRYVWAYNQRSAPQGEIIGHFDDEIFTAEEAAHFTAVKRRVLEEGVELREQRWLDRPAGRMFLDISWEPIRDGSGKIVGVASATIDQTSIKLAEEALARSSQKNAEILDSIQDDFYVLDRGWRFVHANRQFTSKVGKEPADFVGRNIWEMFPKHVGTVYEANLRAAMDRREVRRFEIPGQYTDAFYRMTAFPSAEGITVLGADVTEIKRAEELRLALAEQEKLRLGAALEQASDAVVMVDLDGTIRYVNAAFEAINGVGRDRAVGLSYFEFLAGTSPAAGDIREAVAAGRPWHGALAGSLRDGRPLDLQVTISPAKDPSGRVIGGLVTERDVTRETALQNQVRQAQKMEALGTLAGGITHDFNNILGTIVLNTELALLDLDPTNPARRPLPLILQAANRGKELVKQIITFSRQRAWERKSLEIAPVVQEALKLLKTTLPKDISIRAAIDPRSGVVLADPSHLHQVVVNLCQNAALAMKDRGGTLEVKLAPVEVDETMTARHPNLRPGPYARLTVSDTGCGMTEAVRDRIFEPFFTTRAPGEGSGLGLAVVHGIVRTYDGEVTVTSQPGGGATFEVYFPRLEGEEPAAQAENEAELERGAERILLAEDEKAQRESLERGLARLGYRVTARADGRSALTAFKKDPAAFDLVITDQIMPRMTGLELAAAISAIRPDIPIVLYTGFSEKVDSGIVGTSGVRDFLMKPYTLREASRVIRKALASKERTA